MKLGQLLKGVNVCDFKGDSEQEIEGLVYDSRHVKTGFMFIALKGHKDDGHIYIHEAVQNGAVAIVAEEFKGLRANVSKARVTDSREALSKIAARFYNYPFKGMNIIGITGTNGKTTTSYLLEEIFSRSGARTGVIGTINYRFSGHEYPAPVTTPESLDLMRLLREMADRDVTDVILEVSSHALDQGRTGDCPFRMAIFTNLTRDHLDYHHTVEEYFKAKSLLFSSLKKDKPGDGSSAIINMDDPWGEKLTALTDAHIVTYGLGSGCQIRADSIIADREGLWARLITPLGEKNIHSPLIGEINIYNILAASAAALSLNIDLDSVADGIKQLQCVPGRLELVKNDQGLYLVVDYAHTPDALLKTLNSLRPLVEGKLLTVFGCGGDRDRGKRDEMGFVAGKNSTLVFITSDNPRSEDPFSIIERIEKGVMKSGLSRLEWEAHDHLTGPGYFIEIDRREAIRKAVAMADEKDLVLIAGKGHEDYQIVGGERRYFNDREEAALAASGVSHQSSAL